MTNSNVRMLGFVTTLAGLALSLVSAKVDISNIMLVPAWIFSVLLVAGVVSSVCGIILLLAPYLSMSIVPLRYAFEVARESDLADIHALATNEIGFGLISKKSLMEWYAANPTMIWVVRSKARSLIFRKSRIVGFFSVVPITAIAREKLRKNREQSFQVTVESIVPQGLKPDAWYISAVAATGMGVARGRILQRLEGYVQAKSSEASLFLVAPTTEPGLRVARDNGFTPTDANTDPLETIYYREFG